MFFWFFILTLASFPQRVSSFDSSPRSLVLIPSWITYSKRPPWHHFVLLSRPSYLSSLYQFITSRRMVPNCRSILPRTAKAFSGCIDHQFTATSSALDTYWHIPRYSTVLCLPLWPSWALAYIDGLPDLKREVTGMRVRQQTYTSYPSIPPLSPISAKASQSVWRIVKKCRIEDIFCFLSVFNEIFFKVFVITRANCWRN